jgi:hypothetical protein
MGDGEVKLTVTEATQLAAAPLSFAHQAGQDLAYAASDASPCYPGKALPCRRPAVVHGIRLELHPPDRRSCLRS